HLTLHPSPTRRSSDPNNDAYTTAEDTPLTVAAPGVLANDTDVDGDSLTVGTPRPVSGPIHGTLTLNANGSFTYSPAANFNGTDSFTYKANDGTADSNVATVTLTVTAVNDAPVANNDSATTAEDTSVSVHVLANDTPGPSNESSQTLNIDSVTSGPSHGTATINDNGTPATGDDFIVYSPAANYNG